MIVCPIHDTDVEIDDQGGTRGTTLQGWCPEDGGHLVEVEAD